MLDRFDARSIFLDISKAFDKVWHEGIIFKLGQTDISGELSNLFMVTTEIQILKSRTFQDFQGQFSNFSRTTERKIQGHFHDIWLKSNNIKEIPGPKLIIKKVTS